MRGLIDHEGKQRSRHYLKSAAECTSRAIVSLELAEHEISSVQAARKLDGVGMFCEVTVTGVTGTKHRNKILYFSYF